VVAQRSNTPVSISYELAGRPPRQVETVLYFVACEAITNAAKHSGAGQISVQIGQADGAVVMRIQDDGVGGADPAGSGLQGLARRVTALDGRIAVDSPPGGPTTVEVELPCA
jgi:signal transduction histidine kinase